MTSQITLARGIVIKRTGKRLSSREYSRVLRLVLKKRDVRVRCELLGKLNKERNR